MKTIMRIRLGAASTLLCVGILGGCAEKESPGIPARISKGVGDAGISERADTLAERAVGDTGASTPVNIPFAVSAKARNTNPAISAYDLAQFSSDNAAFMSNMYRRWAATHDGKNLIFSPYSLSSALAMAYAGALGNTKVEMAAAMQFVLPQEKLHQSFNAVALALESRGRSSLGVGGRPFRLDVANVFWGQSNSTWLPSYLDLLAVNYGTGIYQVDFLGASESARLTINEWVAQRTERRILDLLPSGAVNSATRAVLTNTVYFDAAWAQPFMPELTADRPFNLFGGKRVMTPMMHQRISTQYLEGQSFGAVELLYSGDELSALIVVPDAGQFAEVESQLGQRDPLSFFQTATRHAVELQMPKFKIRSAIQGKDQLVALGMKDAFNEQSADFSGINGLRNLAIKEVVHQAFVDVTEAGTVAAAATAVVLGGGGGGQLPPATLVVDRPFFFFIRDVQTGTILFMGRVMDPTVPAL